VRNRLCPICGKPLSSYIYEDSDGDDFEELNFFSGECEFCCKEFTWTEVYKFSEIRDMEEVED